MFNMGLLEITEWEPWLDSLSLVALLYVGFI